MDYLLAIGEFERIAARLAAAGETLHAPHLLDLEVGQALRRLLRRGALSDARAMDALTDMSALGVRRYPHTRLLGRIWELRANVSVFDAAYVALAEALDAPLITADQALARAPGHRARIELYH